MFVMINNRINPARPIHQRQERCVQLSGEFRGKENLINHENFLVFIFLLTLYFQYTDEY